jgi:hypothetical protein
MCVFGVFFVCDICASCVCCVWVCVCVHVDTMCGVLFFLFLFALWLIVLRSGESCGSHFCKRFRCSHGFPFHFPTRWAEKKLLFLILYENGRSCRKGSVLLEGV